MCTRIDDAAHTVEARYPSDQAYLSERYQMGFKTQVLSFSNPFPPRKEVQSLGLNNLVGYVKLDHSKPGNQGKLLVITLAKASY